MDQWEAGPYEGDLVGATCSASSQKGTPCIVLTFDIGGHKKDVTLWLSDAAIDNTEKKLIGLGWNLDYEKPTFTKSKGIALKLDYEEYKGKPKERWELGFVMAAAPTDVLKRLSARARSVHGASRPAPAGKPVPPAKPNVGVTNPLATSKESAWEYWKSVFGAEPPQDKWHDAIKSVGADEDKFTPQAWNTVAGKALPF